MWKPSTVNNEGVATMEWNFASNLSDINKNQFLLNFGLYAGPGYTGGHLFDANNICIDGSGISIAEAFQIDPAKNSSGDISLSDTAFQSHDFAYFDAEHQSNEVELNMQADITLLLTLAAINR